MRSYNINNKEGHFNKYLNECIVSAVCQSYTPLNTWFGNPCQDNMGKERIKGDYIEINQGEFIHLAVNALGLAENYLNEIKEHCHQHNIINLYHIKDIVKYIAGKKFTEKYIYPSQPEGGWFSDKSTDYEIKIAENNKKIICLLNESQKDFNENEYWKAYERWLKAILPECNKIAENNQELLIYQWNIEHKAFQSILRFG